MEHVFFHGCYDSSFDPLILESDYVKQMANNIWKASGYLFQ